MNGDLQVYVLLLGLAAFITGMCAHDRISLLEKEIAKIKKEQK